MLSIVDYIIICYVVVLVGNFVSAEKCENATLFLSCPTSELYVRIGEKKTLSCSRNKEISFCQWYIQQDASRPARLSSTSKIGKRECLLTLFVSEDSSGWYYCAPTVNTDTQPVPQTKTKVTVIQEPEVYGIRRVRNPGDAIFVREGADESLTCGTRNGRPPPSYSWFIDTLDVTHYAEDVGYKSILKLDKIQDLYKYNQKNVVCSIDHMSFKAPHVDNATLYVMYKPRLLNYQSTYTVDSLGQRLVIPFYILSSPGLKKSRKILTIKGNKGVEYRLSAGGEVPGVYTLSEPIFKKGSHQDYFEIMFIVHNVSESVLGSNYTLYVTNKEKMASDKYSFNISLPGYDHTWVYIAVFLLGVIIVVAVIGSVLHHRRRQKAKLRERVKSYTEWAFQENVGKSIWDSLPNLFEDTISKGHTQAPPIPNKNPMPDDCIYENTISVTTSTTKGLNTYVNFISGKNEEKLENLEGTSVQETHEEQKDNSRQPWMPPKRQRNWIESTFDCCV